MYRLHKNIMGGVDLVIRLADDACIPLDPANADYQIFKLDLANGVELRDAEGNAMAATGIQTFLAGLK
jgi:hypothetical protein